MVLRNGEWHALDLLLNSRITVLETEDSLDVIYGILRVLNHLLLGLLSVEDSALQKRNDRGNDSVSRVVRDNDYDSILNNTDRRVRCAKINSGYGCLRIHRITLPKCSTGRYCS